MKRKCDYCGKEYVKGKNRRKKVITRNSNYCSSECGSLARKENCKKYFAGLSYEERYGDRADEIRANLWRNRPKHEINKPYVGGDGRNWIKTSNSRARYAVYLAKKFIVKRDLYAYECVHHRDNDPTNDDLSNLMVVTRTEHAHIHKPYGGITC
jgi:hypothetical protein